MSLYPMSLLIQLNFLAVTIGGSISLVYYIDLITSTQFKCIDIIALI